MKAILKKMKEVEKKIFALMQKEQNFLSSEDFWILRKEENILIKLLVEELNNN